MSDDRVVPKYLVVAKRDASHVIEQAIERMMENLWDVSLKHDLTDEEMIALLKEEHEWDIAEWFENWAESSA